MFDVNKSSEVRRTIASIIKDLLSIEHDVNYYPSYPYEDVEERLCKIREDLKKSVDELHKLILPHEDTALLILRKNKEPMPVRAFMARMNSEGIKPEDVRHTMLNLASTNKVRLISYNNLRCWEIVNLGPVAQLVEQRVHAQR